MRQKWTSFKNEVEQGKHCEAIVTTVIVVAMATTLAIMETVRQW